MSVWDSLLEWFRSVLETTPPGETPPQEPPPAMQPRVLLITFNPTIESEGGRTLTQVLGRRNVDQLCQGFIADLKECSAGLLEYQITQRIDADVWPAKIDGFRYDGAGFLRSWRNRSGFHDPDQVDYEAIIADYDLIQRVESGQIDEVWLFGFPYAGFYESIMVGPGAFWCNAPPIVRDDVSRRFVIMGFNYERGVGPMLESFGHRVESHLQHTWRHHHGRDNLWKQFILYDKKAPGKANCGWMHYAPNSVIDYDWGNESWVLSNCDDWLNFPNFQGVVRRVNCQDWGNGDMRAHHKWWFDRLPRASGHTHGIANNWWWYGVDPNAVE